MTLVSQLIISHLHPPQEWKVAQGTCRTPWFILEVMWEFTLLSIWSIIVCRHHQTTKLHFAICIVTSTHYEYAAWVAMHMVTNEWCILACIVILIIANRKTFGSSGVYMSYPYSDCVYRVLNGTSTTRRTMTLTIHPPRLSRDTSSMYDCLSVCLWISHSDCNELPCYAKVLSYFQVFYPDLINKRKTPEYTLVSDQFQYW